MVYQAKKKVSVADAPSAETLASPPEDSEAKPQQKAASEQTQPEERKQARAPKQQHA